MFYHRIIIIIFCSYIFGYLPSEPTLSNYTNQSRIDIQGWPSLGIIDLKEGSEETIIAGTGAGLGRIINTSLLGSIEDNLYEIRNDDLLDVLFQGNFFAIFSPFFGQVSSWSSSPPPTTSSWRNASRCVTSFPFSSLLTPVGTEA